MNHRLFWAGFGLIAAFVVHLAYVLWIPYAEINERMTQFEKLVGVHHMRLIGVREARFVPAQLPQMEAAACVLDLSKGDVHIHGKLPIGYWMASLYDQYGRPVLMLDDQQADKIGLNIFVSQADKKAGDVKPDAIGIKLSSMRGLFVIQARLPGSQYRKTWRDYLRGIACNNTGNQR